MCSCDGRFFSIHFFFTFFFYSFFFLGKDLTRFESPHDREWRDAFHVWEAPWGAGWVAVDG
jgi:hypothetical protein